MGHARHRRRPGGWPGRRAWRPRPGSSSGPIGGAGQRSCRPRGAAGAVRRDARSGRSRARGPRHAPPRSSAPLARAPLRPPAGDPRRWPGTSRSGRRRRRRRPTGRSGRARAPARRARCGAPRRAAAAAGRRGRGVHCGPRAARGSAPGAVVGGEAAQERGVEARALLRAPRTLDLERLEDGVGGVHRSLPTAPSPSVVAPPFRSANPPGGGRQRGPERARRQVARRTACVVAP